METKTKEKTEKPTNLLKSMLIQTKYPNIVKVMTFLCFNLMNNEFEKDPSPQMSDPKR